MDVFQQGSSLDVMPSARLPMVSTQSHLHLSKCARLRSWSTASISNRLDRARLCRNNARIVRMSGGSCAQLKRDARFFRLQEGDDEDIKAALGIENATSETAAATGIEGSEVSTTNPGRRATGVVESYFADNPYGQAIRRAQLRNFNSHYRQRRTGFRRPNRLRAQCTRAPRSD